MCVCVVVIETFTTGCPGWSDCENNTVRSFWNRVSAAVSHQQECTSFARKLDIPGITQVVKTTTVEHKVKQMSPVHK